MNKLFSKEWDDIISVNVIEVYNFEELSISQSLAGELHAHITGVFDLLKKIKSNKFYNNKEVESIYFLIKESVNIINEILIMLNNSITVPVYELILNVFEELVLLAEDYEMFEMSGNLLKIRDYWFDLFNILIKNINKKGAK